MICVRLIQSAVTNATVLFNSCTESESVSGKDTAIEINKKYLNKSKLGDLFIHIQETIKTKKTCSGEKCTIRTTLFCKNCQKVYCRDCYSKFYNITRMN